MMAFFRQPDNTEAFLIKKKAVVKLKAIYCFAIAFSDPRTVCLVKCGTLHEKISV